MQGSLTCTQEELPGHSHDANCYGQALTCKLAENHIHTGSCWRESTACTESIRDGHIHGPGCLGVTLTLVCTIPEGHAHSEGCHAQQLLCADPEMPGHTHGDECYARERTLSCDLEERENAIPAEQKRICDAQAHIHTLSCHSDPRADLENALTWEKSMAAAELTGEWAHDVVAIARTQLGYRESEENFQVLSDGISTQGYSRYGAWYGDPYGDWCAMFASFCLKYADVDMPLESNVDRWIEKLSAQSVGLYRSQGSHIPEPGQLIFFDWDGDGSCNHVGIVAEVTAGEGGSVPKITTIEGNTANQVRAKTYSMDNSTILGYGMLPVQTAASDEIDQNAVNAVIAKINALPSLAELEAELAAFNAEGNTVGYEERVNQVREDRYRARKAYNALSLQEQQQVTNIDKLTALETNWKQDDPYTDLPHAVENTRVYLFDYGHMINEKITGEGMGLLPFYRIFPEYGYTVDGEAAWDHDTVGDAHYGQLDTYAPVINNTLVDGYPYISEGNQNANHSWLTQWGSLRYLFDPDYVGGNYWGKDYWVQEIRKNEAFTNPYTADAVNPTGLAAHFRRAYLPVKNDGSGTGLFLRDEEGYWYYDSGKNAAWYNPETEQFELYNYTLIPGHEAFENYGGTTNGNFLPFNKGHVEGLTDYQTSEKKVHDSGGDLNRNSGEVRWDQRVTAQIGQVIDEYPLLRENFRLITSDRNNAVNLNFGMVVEFDFYMPKDGMINGKPMEFIFKGDDDVWVFIDDVLVLDIGGCHGAEPASINFSTGALSQPGSGIGFHKPTTLKNAFDNAGVTGRFSGDTFENFTAHTLKFFYMERGGNISFCRLKFNMPQLPENAITVTKELSSDVQTLGNPDYTFALMAQGSNGQTNKLFVGNTNLDYSVFAKNKYRIMDVDGTYLTNPNPVDDDTGLFQTDEFGIFKLKAGQTAVFEKIPASADYDVYVQELFTEADYQQYMTDASDNKCTSDIQVNGSAPIWQGKINWSGRVYFNKITSDDYDSDNPYIGPYGHVWYGASGPITDASAGASSGFYFNQCNGVYEDRLAKLSITKAVVAEANAPALTYRINVELDGEPLPAGTTYTVGSATRNVGFDESGNSFVELAGGETAVISNILSGTKFRIWESEESAERHTVTYTNNSASGHGENVVVDDSGVTGTLRVYDQVKLTVTNTRIPQTVSISVVKELTSTTGVEMVGDPEFSFQIMKGDANGNWTSTPFFDAGVPYTIYDNATGTRVGTGETETFGVFKIKAGQRAEFTGISDNIGNYYIRELLDKTFGAQYSAVYVDGQLVTGPVNVTDPITEIVYAGMLGPVKSSYSGDTVFTFNNQVDAEKLSYLTITKWVNGLTADQAERIDYEMDVKLNGSPIPVGTPYTLYQTDAFINNGEKIVIENNPHRVVTTEGIVCVPGGATAEIDNILPGTTFHVSETTGSAFGYKVEYGEFWGKDWIDEDADGNGIGGTVPVNDLSNPAQAHVCVTVKNTLDSTPVMFSAYKEMRNGSYGSAEVGFTATCIQALDGSKYSRPTASGKDGFENGGTDITSLIGHQVSSSVVTNGTELAEAAFQLYFNSVQFSGCKLPVKLVYQITEDPATDLEYSYDPTMYYAVFYLYNAGSGKLGLYENTVYLSKSGVYPQGTVLNAEDVVFRNDLLGDLTLEKVVAGDKGVQDVGRFAFTIELGVDEDNPLQNVNLQLIRNNGAAETVSTGDNGIITLTDVKHEDKIVLRGIPLGVVWRITETPVENFTASWTKNGVAGSSNVATGDIPAGGMEVVYNNTYEYVLPETGGNPISYTMAGWMLMLLSAAYLLYIHSKCRKEAV